jgi:ankyrin repeat protein
LKFSFQTYKKRAGTSDRGKDYEWLLCAFYCLKLSTTADVVEFDLLTNSEFFGDFDDITLRVKYIDGSVKVFLLQLKHSEKAKTLALNSLTAPSGDFTFFKYQKSYDNILSLKNFHFILYTNKTANFKDKTQLTLGDRRIAIRQHSCVGGKLLDTNRGRNCSVFRFESESDQKWDFLSNFYIYVNQQNDTNLKQSISDLLKTRLECDVYTTFVEFMRGWWAGSFKLTKYDVVAKLAELVLSPMVKTVSGEECNDKTRLIEEAILKFDMTIVEPGGGEKITKIWSKTLEPKDMKVVSLTALKFGLVTKGIGKMSDLSMEKQAKVLWFMDQVPLVVQQEASKKNQLLAVISLIEGCRKKKRIVLIGHTDAKFPSWNTFTSLSDIPRGDTLRKTITQTLTCSLQGKKSISLEEMHIVDDEIASAFTLHQLLEISTDDNFNIGEPVESLPPTYIPRFFYKILMNYSVIDGLKECRILLSCKGEKERLQKKFNKRMVPLSCYWGHDASFCKHYVYVSDGEFDRGAVDDLMQDKKADHHFRFSAQNIQWLTSREVQELRKYKRVDASQVFGESEIEENVHHKIRVLASHTGTGKTSFLNRVKNQAPANFFVIKINLRDHLEFFQSDHKENLVWDYLADFVSKTRSYNDFERKVVRNFDKTKTIILWDSFDDLPQKSRKSLIGCLEYLKKWGVTQWVAARNQSGEFLQNKLKVFALTMLPFRQDDQIYYMRNRCGATVTTVANFFTTMKILDDQEYLGVPLLLFILTDIFTRDPDLLDKVYTLTDMFGAFIDGKYDHFLKKSANNDLGSLRSLIEHGKEHRLDQYKIAAVCTHLPDLHNKLKLQNSKKFVSDITKGDFLGLVAKVDADGFVFEHQVLGEYLAALYLSENLKVGLEEFLFEEKHRKIRFLFDLLLAENEPSLVSILYKKFDEVGEWAVKGRAGRSPLHLLCSYGEKHPVLRQDSGVLEAKLGESVREDDESLRRAVRVACQKCNPLERDGLFGWTSFDYADRSLSLGLVEILRGDLGEILPTLHHYKDLATVLYYSVRFDYQNLFVALNKQIPYVESSGGGNLLHVATEFGRENFLTWLLSLQIYQKSINKSNENRWNPVHIASFNGNLDLVKFLREKGSTFPLRDPSVMSLATTHGYKSIVQFLVENSCSPNEFYHLNYFTQSLPLAITKGYVEIVDFLLRNGAKFYNIGKNHMNALHMALEHEQFDVARLLLERGIDIDAVDGSGRNSYHHASMNNQKAVVLFLLARGAEHRHRDEDKRTPLHLAALSGSLQVVEVLVGENVEIDAADNAGMTPLHLAVCSGQYPLVKFLLEAGSNPNAPNKFKRTPLHLAALNGLSEVIDILHAHNGDFEAKDCLYGRKPLHYAAWNGHEDCVEALLKLGAGIDPSCNFGYTPLLLATKEDNIECCQLLLQAGASPQIANRYGGTALDAVRSHAVLMLMAQRHAHPLHYAVSEGSVEAISELVALGHDVNQTDRDGSTPLRVALDRFRSNEFVRVLIEKGADLGARDRGGYIPLHHALQARFLDEKTLELLLGGEGGNYVNQKTDNGLTPLHIAANSCDRVECINLLLDKGARYDATDDEGFVPLHYATLGGSFDVVEVLVGRDSRVDRVNKHGRTPLHLAATKGNLPVVQFLLYRGASVRMTDDSGDTPLDDALQAEQPQVFKLLLSRNPDFNVATTNHKGRTVLHMAAKQGSLDLLKFFIDKVPVDVADVDDNTAIDDALFSRHFDVFDFLLTKSPFDVNKRNKRHKRYPLHVAASTNTLDLVELFLERGARVDVVDDEGNTPLHDAVASYKDDVVLLLVNDSRALDIQNKKGQTPLHLAMQQAERDLINPLVDKGAQVDLVDNDGNTPFDVLFNQGYFSCGEKVFLKMKNFDLNKRVPMSGQTVLHLAADNDSLEVVSKLIERGASVNVEDRNGQTPLFCALSESEEIARLLLEKCEVDVHHRDKKGRTILHVAVEYAPALVDRILQMGAAIDAVSESGTPLEVALNVENSKMFKYLWDKTPQADVLNMVKNNARTPLHMAADQGDLQLVKLLLEKGLKINDVDKMGNTPLDAAAQNEHLPVLEVLLERDNGTVVNKSDNMGRTLLHVAAKNGNFEMVELLVRKGAKVELCDGQGKTAAEIALEEGHEKIYEFLKN